jgi:hypothetical protein
LFRPQRLLFVQSIFLRRHGDRLGESFNFQESSKLASCAVLNSWLQSSTKR